MRYRSGLVGEIVGEGGIVRRMNVEWVTDVADGRRRIVMLHWGGVSSSK